MIRVFDMFAGYGGAEFALTKAGIEHECVGFSEIDKYAIQCFQQNHKGKCYGDCTKINTDELPDFDLLCGGFPCQDVSIAGKRDLTKGRTNLYKEVLRIAEAKKPKYMLLENVKGLLSIGKDRNLRDIIINDLRKIGYDVCFQCLNSKDFGIPQNRERVWFVCKLGKWEFNEFQFPTPTKSGLKLKDILLEEVEQKYYLTDSQLNTLQRKFGSKGKCLDGRNESDTITTSMGTGGGNVPYISNSSPRECGFKDVSPALLSRDYKDPKVVQIRQGHTKSNGSQIYYSENTRTLETNGNLVILNPFNGKNSTEESGTIGTSVGSTTGKTAQILIDPRKYSGETKPREYTECPTLMARARTDETPILKNSFRKLTPKECFRLMGFVNDEINLEGLSDTQRYKLAGNGWDINIVSKIMKQMFKDELQKNI